MRRCLLLSFVILALSSCSPAVQKGLDTMPGDGFVAVDNLSFQVEVARSEAEHVKGLSGRPPIKDDEGMLFIFEDEQVRSFWMKDMFFPLDIVFIDKSRRIVDIKRDFQPCVPDSCPAYSSVAPARYVLEVNAGRMKGIVPGQAVLLR